MQDVLRLKMAEGLASPPPAFTRREVRLPRVDRKAMAVVGVRRSGKTTFLWQCLADRLAAGAPRESMLFLCFEDERLPNLTAPVLTWLLEEFYRQYPSNRDQHNVTFFFDEIQCVAGWESFARRLVDTERVDLFLSGSSARLLSREVATSMRGRALEVLVHPFSFREVLRHWGEEPEVPWSKLRKAARSKIESRLRTYLTQGGFPETLGTQERDRAKLLRSYVDVVVLRDVIERHKVSNPLALRWMQRQLLSSPAGPFSVQKFWDALRSQGVPVGKDTLHDYLEHLEDSFLVRIVSLHTASERQRMVNPRKAYPVDPGLIPIYDRSGHPCLGHALETVVCLELERRGYEIAYVRTKNDCEVDFLAQGPGLPALLMQVCLDISDAATRDRELRALEAAAKEHPRATPVLLTLESIPPAVEMPGRVKWVTAAEWLLGGGGG